jgi:sarcosine oxidase, subunit gamma
MTAVQPMRRSFVDRSRLEDTDGDLPGNSDLILTDFSLSPRWGLKGHGTMRWLEEAGARVPNDNNTSLAQQDGAIVARLSPGEALVLASPHKACGLGVRIKALPLEGHGACYPAPRQDSHACFRVEGPRSAEMFAKLCGVDLAPDSFVNGRVAQTSLARLSAIIIRHDVDDQLAYYVLCESASAEYLWDCLLDAMAEFKRPTAIAMKGF